MPPDPNISPYDTMIPIIRSLIGDLIYGSVTVEDLNFNDQNVADAINNAFILYIERDYNISDDISINAGNLSEEILEEKKILRPLILASAKKLINLILQTSANDAIDVDRFGDSLNIRSLIKSLNEAADRIQKEYDKQLIYDSEGAALFYNNTGNSLIPNN